jgi:two-component system response regulator PilR (NtrC family)
VSEPSAPPVARVLVVDDDAGQRAMLEALFASGPYATTIAAGFREGLERLRQAPEAFDVVVTDLVMPDGSGLDLLREARAMSVPPEVLVMTAYSSVDGALEAMRAGAYDFLTKPVRTAELRALVERAVDKRRLRIENRRLHASVQRRESASLVGRSAAMEQLRELIARVGQTKANVLITGESGSGKEAVARAIHKLSPRAGAPFVVVHCGAIPEPLLESELFGHDKGAFTGAVARTKGLVREAAGGTIFFDEVGELPLAMQVKLLRVLQEKKVRAVGGANEEEVDVRVLAATNRPVEEDVKAGRLRQDLYYRLNVLRVEVPPLRARRDDVAPLALHFMDRASREQGRDVRSIAPDAQRALDRYEYPGNIRELENVIERAVALGTGPVIGLGDLPVEVAGAAALPAASFASLPEGGLALDEVLNELERRLLLQALDRSRGNRTEAAKLLHVTFRSLRYRLKKHGLAHPGEDDGSANSTPFDDEE